MDSTDALVDVGIPAHGRPEFLIEAIESVLAQTLRSWRLWISEDGPGGGEIEAVVRPYLEDPRIRYLTSDVHLGAARNSTKLIRCGSAPYVHLLHDDDLLKEGFLESHVCFLEANPGCGLVFSSFSQVDAAGRVIADDPPALAEGIYGVEDFVALMLRSNPISTDNAVVRRTAYETVGSEFDPSFPALYDYEMWLRISPHVAAGFLAVNDTCWRRHGAQISFNSYRGDEFLELIRHADDLIRQQRPDLCLSPALQRRREAGAYLTGAVDALDQDDRHGAAQRLGAALRMTKRGLADPRTYAVLVGLAFGRLGRRAAIGARRQLHKRGIRLAYRPYPPGPNPPEPAATSPAPPEPRGLATSRTGTVARPS